MTSGLQPTGMGRTERYPCPCCGYLTAAVAGDYEICPICGWEDDPSQLRFASMAGGANKPSLIDAQRNFELRGLSDPEAMKHGRISVRMPTPSDRRDGDWRPIRDEEVEVAEPGVDQGRNYPPSIEQLYYWRPTFWRRMAGWSIGQTIMSFSFRVVKGRVDREDEPSLNDAFPDDDVNADIDRQMVHVDRVCTSAALQLPDLEARLRQGLPGRALASPHIWAFAGRSSKQA